MMTYLFAGAGALLGVQALLLWRMLRVSKGLRQCDERLAHFGDALALLTETAESGFQAMAAEVSRLAAPVSGSAARRTTTRRIASAARRGKTVPQIAAEEEVSEGEVRLRLQLCERTLAEQTLPSATPMPGHAVPETNHGTLRA